MPLITNIQASPATPSSSTLSSPLTSSLSMSSPLPSSSTHRTKSRSPAMRRANRSSRTNESSKHSSLLPTTVRYLQQLRFRVIASRSSSRHVQYVLLVQHKQDELPWTVSRSFSDYHALQKRLLAAMHLGHFCHANCPWLYSFVKSHFPTHFRWLASSTFVVTKRVDALTQCFATLHAHLVDRTNHCCSVLTNTVATELIEFINADLPPTSDAHWSHFADMDVSRLSVDGVNVGATPPSPLDISVRPATDLSNATTLSGARGSRASHGSNVCSLCSAKGRSSDVSSASSREQSREVDTAGEPSDSDIDNDNDTSRHDQSALDSQVDNGSERFSPALSSLSSPSVALTTLSCGHAFHDECIVPCLNESLRCPTCGHAQAFC